MIFQSQHAEIPVPSVPFQEFVLHQATNLATGKLLRRVLRDRESVGQINQIKL